MSSIFIDGKQVYGVESGGNATTGYYIKHADGRLICYGKTTPINSGTLTSVGYMYYGEITCNFDFPVPFIETPSVSSTIHSSNIASCDGLVVTSTRLARIGIMSPQTSVNNVWVEFIAIGRWK